MKRKRAIRKSLSWKTNHMQMKKNLIKKILSETQAHSLQGVLKHLCVKLSNSVMTRAHLYCAHTHKCKIFSVICIDKGL